MQLKVKGIMSYPHLSQPRAVNPGDDPKYSVAILIRKDDPQVAQIQQAIETEKANGFPSGFPANGKMCLKDCAVTDPDKPQLANYYCINTNAAASSKPAVVDSAMQPVMDPAQAYAGAVAWFAISVYAFNKPVNKGVGAGINGVMLTGEEGELGRLDGRPTVEQMFGDVSNSAPAPAPRAPTAPTAPSAPPVAPPTPVQFPPEGWAEHPQSPGYYYCGQEVLSKADLCAKFGIVEPSFA